RRKRRGRGPAPATRPGTRPLQLGVGTWPLCHYAGGGWGIRFWFCPPPPLSSFGVRAARHRQKRPLTTATKDSRRLLDHPPSPSSQGRSTGTMGGSVG